MLFAAWNRRKLDIDAKKERIRQCRRLLGVHYDEIMGIWLFSELVRV